MAKEKQQPTEQFEDDTHVVIENDIERLQVRTGMYMANKGSRGAMQMARENINNHIDECTNEKSPGRNIEILLDTNENTLMSSDDGRGIPFDKLVVLCTRIQSSSKMTRSQGGGGSAGENGVGMTAVNALSERFESISTRYGEQASIKFREGIMVEDVTVKKIKDKEAHGQTFIFKPSDKHLSVEDDPAILDRDVLENWVHMISYMLPGDIKVRFNVAGDGGKMYSKKYQNKNGMAELLQDTYKKITDPVHVKDITYFKETIINEDGEKEVVDRYTGIEVAFAYTTEDRDEHTNAFCNFVHNVDGGTHAMAVQAAIIQVLKDITEKTMTENQLKNMSIIASDIREGLRLNLYARTSADPGFSGQVKEKVNSQLLYKQIRPMVTRAVREALRKDDKLAKKITDIIKANAKARLAADKEKEAVIKRSKTEQLDQYDIDRYIPCKVESRNQYSEIQIVEGDSAGNAIKSVGFDFQAALYLKGVPINAFTAKKTDILKNNEMRTFIRAVQTGIGEDFDLEKFFFDKVVIMPDGDSDGGNIFSNFAAFLLKWMRPLVEAGRVYRALPPLYKIADKDNPYIKSRVEYFEIYVKNVLKGVRVGNSRQGVLDKDTFRELLENNRDYLEELDRLVRYFGIHPDILEFVIYHGKDADFAKKLKKRFPEISIDSKGKHLQGVYEGKYQYLKIGKRFMKQAVDLLEIVFQDSNKALYFTMYDKKGKELKEIGEFTLGGVLKQCLQFKPRIKTRYKGLGELKPEELRDTVLDPNNRILVQLTVADIEKAMEVADIFHGNDSSKRLEANSNFRIRRDELDN